jgi:hypothetical protein
MMRSLALETNSTSRLNINEPSKTPKHDSTTKQPEKKHQRSKSEGNSSAACLSLLNAATHEHHAKRQKKRKRSEYEDNYSAALALPCSSEKLETLKDDQKSLLTLSQDHIKEHAARRVDLFFYTLVAYYNTGLSPLQGHTSLQHGKGRNTDDLTNMTQACHSSLLPALIDENSTLNFRNMQTHDSILSGTHFLDNLNSTVELPVMVNEFDGELENTYLCRDKSIHILQKVSAGEISPIEGLNQFMKMMDMTLKNIDAKIKKTGTMFAKIHPNESELFLLIKQGTFAKIYSSETETATREYIETLLRLKPEEKALCKTSHDMRNKIYLKKMTSLQLEILNTERERLQVPYSP